MKRIAIFLLQFSFCLLSLGQGVTLEEAQRVAINHSLRIKNDLLDVETIQLIMSGESVCLYQIILTDGSWCYVSSDKRTIPILAYGTSRDFFDDIPDAFSDLINWYAAQIIDLKTLGRDGLACKPSWDTLLLTTRAFPEEYSEGDGLLNTTGRGLMQWAQYGNKDGGCTPSYNQDCPIGFWGCDCGHTPVGCGAVAMGMVMWYWQWPESYQWEMMPPVLYGNTPTEQASLLAEFLHYCGFKCSMTYMCAGSSTIGPNIMSALHELGYESANVYDKDDWWPWAWQCLLLSEIDNRRPVIYYGQSSNINFTSGHFFVVDGYRYNPDLEFHINFGHGTAGAWCTLDNIYEGSSSYSYQNAAIIGISPTYNANNISQLNYDRIRSNEWRTEYAYSYIHVPAINNSLAIDSGGRLYLEAGSEIVLQPGFEAKLGSEVSACINDGLINQMDISWSLLQSSIQTGDDLVICTQNADSWELKVRSSSSYVYQGAGGILADCTFLWENVSIPEGRYRANLVLKNSYGRRLESRFDIAVTREGDVIIVVEPDNADLTENPTDESLRDASKPHFDIDFQDSLFPNPTSGELTVTAEGEVQDIVIYNAQGKPVGGWNMLSMASGRITLDVSPLPAGTYLLTVRTTDGKTCTGKFVKQ